MEQQPKKKQKEGLLTVIKVVKHEPKRTLTIEEAVEQLKKYMEEIEHQKAMISLQIYEIYKQVKYGEWNKVLQKAHLPKSTWYDWVERYNLETRWKHSCPKSDNFIERKLVQTVAVLKPDGKGGTTTVMEQRPFQTSVEHESEYKMFHSLQQKLAGYYHIQWHEIKTLNPHMQEQLLNDMREARDHLSEQIKESGANPITFGDD